MKTGQIKLVCYVLALILVGLGAKDVYAYIQAKKVNVHTGVEETVTKALSDVEHIKPKRTGIVSYEDVKVGYHQFDWTGKPPPKVVTNKNEGPVKPVIVSVDTLISVLMLRYDTDNPEDSVASIVYKSTAQVDDSRIKTEGQDLRKGDTLAAPNDWATVVGITVEGIEFSFSEEGRENEVVGPDFNAEAVIYLTDAAGAIRPSKDGRRIIQRAPGAGGKRFRDETYERRPGQFRIGYEDQQAIAENYPTLISSEIRHRRHRDPKTGRFDGIEIQSVTPGGLASRHGAQQGDIIRSINGHPVTSVAEAVSFVRDNKDKYDVWEVEIENQGRVRTVTYESPPDN